jgi:hypothetical protein
LLCLPVNSSSNTTPKLHTLHLAYARLIFIVYNNIKRRYKRRFIYNGGGHFPKPANLFLSTVRGIARNTTSLFHVSISEQFVCCTDVCVCMYITTFPAN